LQIAESCFFADRQARIEEPCRNFQLPGRRTCRPPGLVWTGTIRFKTRLLYLSTALRLHRVGLEEVDDGIWSRYFCNVLLGRIAERKALMKGQLGLTYVPGCSIYSTSSSKTPRPSRMAVRASATRRRNSG